MAKFPLFLRRQKNYGEILPNPEKIGVICIWRAKGIRFWKETILIPAFDVNYAVAADVAEAMYMAANYAAEITGKNRPKKNAGRPGKLVEDGWQVFANDSRYVVRLRLIPAELGGGVHVVIPEHRSMDLHMAVQTANVIYQACEKARKLDRQRRKNANPTA